MRISAQLKADQAREGMRVTYGPSTRKTGTLTGETRVVSGVTRFKVRPIDGGRAVWAVYVWEDATADVATASSDPRVVPVPETVATARTMFEPSLTFYADGTRVAVQDVSALASDMWNGRTGVTVGYRPAFPYGFQAVRWDDSGRVDNVVPHILREVHEPVLGSSTCQYVLDGHDADGTPFYECTTHGEVEISHEAPCAVGISEHDAPEHVAPLAPGDRVEIGGRERVATSVVPGRRRGRRTLYVAHVAPGDALAVADVTTVPVPLDTPRENYSPRVIAAHVLASAAHTLRSAGVIIPETPASARREYVAARERGETVSLALTRARLEVVAYTVLTPTRSGWTVNRDALTHATIRPELDALSGTVRDADGQRLLFPIVVPDGITLTVSTERDDHSDRPEDEGYYSPEDVDAWCGDLWGYRAVTVTAWDVDGDELWAAPLGGVEVGSYWPGTECAQIWPHLPGLIRDVLDSLPDDALPMTCGTCGHRYADNTPAGRCPREGEHEPDGPGVAPAAAVLREVTAELNRYEENAELGTSVQDAATDVVQRLFDLYGVRPVEGGE